MTKILVAEASSYLGKFVLQELDYWKIPSVALVQSLDFLQDLNLANTEIMQVELVRPESLMGVCAGVDTVISTISLTRNEDELSGMDINDQANLNLLLEAERAEVRKFVYVSQLDEYMQRHPKAFESNVQFVDALKASSLAFTVIRPCALFSDLRDVLLMAKKGRIVLFGDGEYKLNPIHGADLADVCVRAIAQQDKETIIGGPDILTQNEIAELALCAWKKPANIIHLPNWTRFLMPQAAKKLLPKHRHGLFELTFTRMESDRMATRHGNHRLQDYFFQEVRRQQQH